MTSRPVVRAPHGGWLWSRKSCVCRCSCRCAAVGFVEIEQSSLVVVSAKVDAVFSQETLELSDCPPP